MGFHKSSMDVHLKANHILCAYCRRPTGEATYSELDLNQFLGTKKGKQTLRPRAVSLADNGATFSKSILHIQQTPAVKVQV